MSNLSVGRLFPDQVTASHAEFLSLERRSLCARASNQCAVEWRDCCRSVGPRPARRPPRSLLRGTTVRPASGDKSRSAECYVRKCRSRRRVPNGHPPAEVAAIPAVARRHRQAIPEPNAGRGQASIQESLADATVQKEAQSDIEMQTDRTAKTQFFMKGPANPAAGVTAVRRGPVPSAGVPA